MSSTKTILGLDVSKDKLDACLLTTPPRTLTVPNTPAGHARLLAWAAEAGPLHLGLEATSTYGWAVARHAHAAGHIVSVLQPLAVQRYAQAKLSRNKTDRLDTAHASVVPMLRSLVRSLTGQITRLDAALVATLEEDAVLEAQAELLRSIPAVGPVLCAGLLAELPADLRTARAAVAYAGLNPRPRESGSSLRGRAVLSKLGNARLRRLLYVPALAGLQHNPVLRAQAARLAAKGKPGKVRVAAVMRKLLVLCVGVLRSGQPWNPTDRPAPKPSTSSS